MIIYEIILEKYLFIVWYNKLIRSGGWQMNMTSWRGAQLTKGQRYKRRAQLEQDGEEEED